MVYEAIGTAATRGLLCQPRVIVKMIAEKQMECRLAGETEVLGENLLQRHFCPSQNPTWPDPRLNPAAVVWSRRLTAWAMARPSRQFDWFFLLAGWDFGYRGHYWPIIPAPDDRWLWLWRNWWNEDWQGKPMYSNSRQFLYDWAIPNPGYYRPYFKYILILSSLTSTHWLSTCAFPVGFLTKNLETLFFPPVRASYSAN
jgi:hypothetical protein